jgi:NAD(P) transhydrogenase
MSDTKNKDDMKSYDLVVIGSGPAGERGAAQAAYFGKRVAIVEKEPYFGGAAANTGTLPSKTLRETALFLSGFHQRGLYGLDANLRSKATVQDLMRRYQNVREIERQRIAGNLGRHDVDHYFGVGRFDDANTIVVTQADGKVTPLHAEKILIATGSRPFHPPVFPFGKPGIYDSDSILNLESIPKSMVVVGGGVIGCEYACMFATLGIKITVVETRSQFMGFLDDEIAQVLKERMIAMGIEFKMPDSALDVDEAGGGQWRVALDSGESLVADIVLVSSGRSGNTDGLNLPSVGITPTSRGQIEVNDKYQTALPHVYAVGDVIGNPALASAAMEQGRLAMCHAFEEGGKERFATILPYGLYTIPEVSVAGETEEDAKAKNLDIVVGRARFAANARGQIVGDDHGFLKLVFLREDMKLIGTHVIGEMASELVHIGLVAMLAGKGADLFIETCFNYPTLSETYKYATYDALNRKKMEAKK